MVMVGQYKRIKVNGTPEERRKIRAGLDLMKKYDWNRLPPDTCVTIKALDAVSHTSGPFVKGKKTCYEINIEPDDLKDDVETGLALGHEFMHVRDITERGLGAVDEPEDELQVHRETKELVEEAMPKEDRPRYMARLAEESKQQDDYIAHYEREAAGHI